jgi:hypothetical protein
MDGSERGSLMSSRKGLHPTRVVAAAFTAIILLGTFLLMVADFCRRGKIHSAG